MEKMAAPMTDESPWMKELRSHKRAHSAMTAQERMILQVPDASCKCGSNVYCMQNLTCETCAAIS